MTIYGLGTTAALLFFLSIHLIFFLFSAIRLDVPFLVAVVANKIGKLLLFTGATFAFAFPLDWGDCIEGGGATIPATFFVLYVDNYFTQFKKEGVTRGQDDGDKNLVRVRESFEKDKTILGVSDTHIGISKVNVGLVQLYQLRPHRLVFIKTCLSKHNPSIEDGGATGGSKIKPLEVLLLLFNHRCCHL